jgi:hypothetical protein
MMAGLITEPPVEQSVEEFSTVEHVACFATAARPEHACLRSRSASNWTNIGLRGAAH